MKVETNIRDGPLEKLWGGGAGVETNIRDGPLEKLWGRGGGGGRWGGKFWAAGIFFG